MRFASVAGRGSLVLLSGDPGIGKTRAAEEIAAGRCRFSRALVRETFYAEIPLAERIVLHRRIGAAIESTYGARLDEHVAELAHARRDPPGGSPLGGRVRRR